MATALQNQTARKILRGLKSHYPVFYLQGWDEDRMERLLRAVARSYYGEDGHLEVWSAGTGFDSDAPDAPTTDPLEAVARVAKGRTEGPRMVLLKDLPTEFEGNPALVRGVRDLYYRLKNSRDVVFLSCPLLKLPEILKKEVFLIEVDLPSEEEVLEQLEVASGASGVPREQLFRVAAGMRGLSLNEVGHLSARLFGGKPMGEGEMLAEIQEEKGQILRKESCLQFYPPQRSLDDIGGLENLKEWVRTRADLFTEKAWRDNVPLPAGVLFMGVSGCGKSMAAKAIATAWGLPLVRLDMSLVLSGSFGTPEYAFARATRIAEEIAPMVLWVDELENAFGFDSQASGSAGNVNIFSSFLTWLQEKSPRVFVAATANRIHQLPAELMRKGRFDQLFFLDLPQAEERKEILRIHVERYGGNIEEFNLNYMAASTEDWSGAEIEQAVKSARIDAYQEGRVFNQRDVIRNVINTVPLSRTMVEQIREIKSWVFQRAINASRTEASGSVASSAPKAPGQEH
ncbi:MULTISPECIES: AAA family ATPase [unclassified Thioalkalivibrio]|uniref:AAA family ATPase n=1 Tax=unclassified Thioalkalivibrio TaxID=2621013 RepID=UPI00037D218A|nr:MULTISPECIES: AAA family ATPase [unclassified Thioalkalivibrio]